MVLENLKKFLDSKGISIAAFEKSIGMSNNSFRKSLNSGGHIGSDKLENILKIYPELNPTWILTGKGSMLQAESISSGSGQATPVVETEESFVYRIYQDQLKIIQGKDDENKTLIKQNAILEERIRQLEADNESLRNQAGADKITDTFIDIPSEDYEEDYTPVKRPSDSKRPPAGKV